jgi:hypothetical protein
MVCKLARIAASSGDETWPLPLLEPLLSTFASTSGGGIVALSFELDDLGLLLFMLFSERSSSLCASCRHAYHRGRDIRCFRTNAEKRRNLERRNLRWS